RVSSQTAPAARSTATNNPNVLFFSFVMIQAMRAFLPVVFLSSFDTYCTKSLTRWPPPRNVSFL
ncbi:MAG: hypothetical protein IJP92_17075, partial [Lachnospiraceae bacterium]|nr:hypothetical protein [Lachnospiraceae bacterium]